jgi:hypothetical protein
MDRRAALKKMAVGGAVVAGASAVTTRTAFAYTRPTITTAPTLTYYGATDIVATNTSKMRFEIAQGAASCPGSATSAQASVSGLTVDVAALLRNEIGGIATTQYPRVLRPYYSGQAWGYGIPQINNSTLTDFKSFNVLNAGHTPNYSIRFTKCSTGGSTEDPAPNPVHGTGINGGDQAYRAGDRIAVRVTITWRCTYSSGSTRDRSQTYNGVIRPPGSSNDTQWGGTSTWVLVSQLA